MPQFAFINLPCPHRIIINQSSGLIIELCQNAFNPKISEELAQISCARVARWVGRILGYWILGFGFWVIRFENFAFRALGFWVVRFFVFCFWISSFWS